MTIAIWVALVILSVFFIYTLSKDIIKHRKVLEEVSVIKTAIIGFVVNFFDVLGIGAFAPQRLFGGRLWKRKYLIMGSHKAHLMAHSSATSHQIAAERFLK